MVVSRLYKSEEYQTSNRGNKGRDSTPACNVNGMPKDRMMDVDDDDDESPTTLCKAIRTGRLYGLAGQRTTMQPQLLDRNGEWL